MRAVVSKMIFYNISKTYIYCTVATTTVRNICSFTFLRGSQKAKTYMMRIYSTRN